ncbi:MAG: hypothetical protein SVR94_11215 [Pseudomonadota bacterium]|nr:hypothetical protein [Pseudomonadota bacterium]
MSDRYLNYIQRLYERERTREQVNGFSVWAIMAAMVYVFWKTIPEASQIVKDGSLVTGLILFGHVYFVLVILQMIFPSGKSDRIFYKFDYRVFPKGRFGSLYKMYFLMTPIMFAPTVVVIYVYSTAEFNNSLHSSIFLSNLILFSFLSVIGVFYPLYSKWYMNNRGMPSISEINQYENRGFANYVTAFIVIVLMLLNIYVIFYLSLSKDIYFSGDHIIFSMNVSILLFLFEYLVSSKTRESRLDSLLSIERDIVLHNIPEEQIRVRLEDEVIGRQFGDWIADKIKNVKERAKELIELADDEYISQVEQQISSVPQEYQNERKARKDKFRQEVIQKANAYAEESKKIRAWLDDCVSHGKYMLHDEYIMNIINDVKEQLDEIHNQVVKIKDKFNET